MSPMSHSSECLCVPQIDVRLIIRASTNDNHRGYTLAMLSITLAMSYPPQCSSNAPKHPRLLLSAVYAYQSFCLCLFRFKVNLLRCCSIWSTCQSVFHFVWQTIRMSTIAPKASIRLAEYILRAHQPQPTQSISVSL